MDPLDKSSKENDDSQDEGDIEEIDEYDFLFIAKNIGLSFKELEEIRYSDALKIILKFNEKNEKNATQSDIDMLAG